VENTTFDRVSQLCGTGCGTPCANVSVRKCHKTVWHCTDSHCKRTSSISRVDEKRAESWNIVFWIQRVMVESLSPSLPTTRLHTTAFALSHYRAQCCTVQAFLETKAWYMKHRLCNSNPCRFEYSVHWGLCWNRNDEFGIDSSALWPTELLLIWNTEIWFIILNSFYLIVVLVL